MATLLKYKKGLKRPTLAWNEFAIRYSHVKTFASIVASFVVVVVVVVVVAAAVGLGFFEWGVGGGWYVILKKNC